jgi:hypothetical protein
MLVTPPAPVHTNLRPVPVLPVPRVLSPGVGQRTGEEQTHGQQRYCHRPLNKRRRDIHLPAPLTNCVIRVRRGIVEGIEQLTKTPSGERIIDLARDLAALLQQHLAGRKSGRVFQAQNRAPNHAGSIRKRVLHPLLEKARYRSWRFPRLASCARDDLAEEWGAARVADALDWSFQSADYGRLRPYG